MSLSYSHVVLVQDTSDYGGASEFWIKWRGNASSDDEALRTAFDGDGWKPRNGDRRTVHAVVVGPGSGWAEYDVRIHYPKSVIEGIEPARHWISQFDGDDDD